MKKFLLTAAALTLGTSAPAWAGMHEDTHRDASAGMQSAAKPGSDGMSWAGVEMKSKAMVGGAMAASAGTGFAKAAGASAGGAKDLSGSDGMMWADADLKSKEMVGGAAMASAQGRTGAKRATDGGLTWAEADIKTKAMVGGAAMAEAGTGADMGQGGPLEPGGYPPCRPGRGDDNCIQLYERGVGADLAARKADDGRGMGGPLEPAAGAKAEAAPAPAAPGGAKVADEGDEAEIAAAGDAPKGAADPHAGHDMNGAKTATPTPN
ncbi:MAG TPA: hypothetical protein VEZ20_00800 [Allosphingosinicella sp.]|nr:hypothetical protein [Allosphingosinicella sp.]